MKTRIIGIRKSGGKIIAFQIEDGRIFPKDDLIQKIHNKEFEIPNIVLAVRNGSPYLKNSRDDSLENNLSNLPQI